MALFNKGNRLAALNRNEDAIAAYDDVVRRSGEAMESTLRELIAMTLVNKSFRLRALCLPEDEMAVCDDVVRRFGDATEFPLREQVERPFTIKASR
jgi:hypothetical protein